MNRVIAVLLVVIIVACPLSSIGQIYPPKPGVEMPQAYFDRLAQDKTAFRFQNAWLKKVERIKQNREAYLYENGRFEMDALSPSQRRAMLVTGTVTVPVFMVAYNNVAGPYPSGNLQTELFSGPFAPQTLTQYYSEISYGNITLTGTVYNWYTLPNNDTFYEGPAGCYGLCGSANVGSFLTSTLTNWDPTVNFGQYDNDGPDGLPNSGDDDGFVDFAAFVHPERGAECGGNNNIWSHRWVISGWTGSSWTSNDPAAGGGFIKVNDYVIQPALSCGGGQIEIGVFCHEFGHAFGLPDLYDTNGGSEGIGEWGLMGSGSWNSVTRPAHMCTWSKDELGWVNLVNVPTNKTTYAANNIEFNNIAYRLNVAEEKWRRTTDCAISGSYSMRCGLNNAEASARSWPGGEGYGNGWSEKVSRTFSYNGGSHPVSMSYDYDYDSEAFYDYTYVKIDVNSIVSTVATYHGAASGMANHDLTSYLSGSGASSYEVIFEFTSDYAYSDEDGYDPSTCGAFAFDNVSVTGGGESYSTDFETDEGGWHVDMVNPSEYFLVENRQPLGSDLHVHGGGGLAIWHIEDNVIHSLSGNTGGSSGSLPHGVALEEADGLGHLMSGANRGDAGDPYPGSTSNMLFDNTTTPNSKSYNNLATNVCVQLLTGNGDPITADMAGGWFLPTLATVVPDSSGNSGPVVVALGGTGFVYGATADLVAPGGSPVINATSVDWIGHALMNATFNLTGAPPGMYDVVINNPGGGSVIDSARYEITEPPVAVAFQAFDVVGLSGGIELAWRATSDIGIEGYNIYRTVAGSRAFVKLNSSGLLPAEQTSYIDASAEPGHRYTYRVGAVDRNGEALSPSVSGERPVTQARLDQNHPNPFNPVTTISFFSPNARPAQLAIYDTQGRLVRVLFKGVASRGENRFEWNGKNDQGQPVGSGVYFYKLTAGDFRQTRKMLLLK